jgi:hypothetical protein
MPRALERQSVAEGPAISPLAGKPAPNELLIDPERLQRDYYERKPDVTEPQPTGRFRHQWTSWLSSSRHV